MPYTDEQDASLHRGAASDHAAPIPPSVGGEPASHLPSLANAAADAGAGPASGAPESPRTPGAATVCPADDDRVPAKPALGFEPAPSLGAAMGVAAPGVEAPLSPEVPDVEGDRASLPAAPPYPEILVARAVRGNLVDACVAGAWAANGATGSPAVGAAAHAGVSNGSAQLAEGSNEGPDASGATTPKTGMAGGHPGEGSLSSGASCVTPDGVRAEVPGDALAGAAPAPVNPASTAEGGSPAPASRGAAVFACVLAVLAVVLLGWAEVMAQPVAAQLGLCLAVVASLLAGSALTRGSLSVRAFWGVQLALVANALAVIAM